MVRIAGETKPADWTSSRSSDGVLGSTPSMDAARAVTLNSSPAPAIQVATSEARVNIGIRMIDDARVTRRIRLPRTGLASTKRAHGDETAFRTRRETVGPWSHGLDHGLIA